MNKFKSILTKANTRKVFIGLSLVGLLYHALILTQLVDYKNAWGGRLQSLEQMYTFEAVSVTMQLAFILLVYLSGKVVNTKVIMVFRVLFAFMTVLFFLNTLGNLYAKEVFEKVVFTPLTLLSAILTFRLALKE